jgi:RNA polymerase sigma-70 factor, ECF subfamily
VVETQDQQIATPGTLGAVLYAQPGKTLVAEREWVELVRAIAAGNQPALHALYDRAHRIVFTLAVRVTGNAETAEEVTVDVFHDVWRRAWNYDPANGTVVGWIMNQARSRAIDRVRFEQRKKRADPEARCEMQEAMTEGHEPDPREVLELLQQGQAIHAAMAGLTPDERQAIEAAFFSGLTHNEAAERLNEPLGTIKTRIRSALKKLRATMKAGEARA